VTSECSVACELSEEELKVVVHQGKGERRLFASLCRLARMGFAARHSVDFVVETNCEDCDAAAGTTPSALCTFWWSHIKKALFSRDPQLCKAIPRWQLARPNLAKDANLLQM